MNTDDFVYALADKYRIYVDRKTVFNYAKQNIITPPRIVNMGKAGGRKSVYSQQSFAEFVAAYILMKKFKMPRKTVIEARQSALDCFEGENDIDRHYAKIWRNYFEGAMQ